ncbi:hypothetical protein Tco_1041318 [Tanacetum coccineum]|uniref:Reverse transcriptase domain-containing protein n=1 Tax=Tanacetum coccineum TaxID=301880 RepID=A0ABQ5GFT6_9ASTR
MPIELGSFDVIIGMDWLSMYHAIIAYAEKIIRIPWGSETLIVYGDGSNQGKADSFEHHFMHQNSEIFVERTSYLSGTCYYKGDKREQVRGKHLRHTIVRYSSKVFLKNCQLPQISDKMEFQIEFEMLVLHLLAIELSSASSTRRRYSKDDIQDSPIPWKDSHVDDKVRFVEERRVDRWYREVKRCKQILPNYQGSMELKSRVLTIAVKHGRFVPQGNFKKKYHASLPKLVPSSSVMQHEP